ncbi:MAG: hypothetical protein WBA74_00800 [Cyclobacteriaceae bacterium]
MQLIRSDIGTDLTGWEVVVGDGLYHAPGEQPVNETDLSTNNLGADSLLVANVSGRRIMAHNITFKRYIDTAAMNSYQEASYKFQLPYAISTANTNFNGQTVEGGLFIWDGLNTQLDYGLAFQWVINPWDPNYKAINIWIGTGWQYLTDLEPDVNFHSIGYKLDMNNQTAFLSIDGNEFSQNVFSSTPKTGWGSEVASRFQAETISIFPASSGSVPRQEVKFKDWKWEWFVANTI